MPFHEPDCKAGASNTRLDSQSFLQASLDYVSVSFTQPSLEVFDETLQYLALYHLPYPVDNWHTHPKSRDYASQKQQYKSYYQNLETRRKVHPKLLSTAILRVAGKPSMIYPGKYHPNRIETLLPLSGGYDLEYEDGTGSIAVNIQLSGQFFAPLGLYEQMDFLKFLSTLPGLKITRLDNALDDFSKKLIPYDQIAKACEDGQYKGFRDGTEVRNFGKQADKAKKIGSRLGTIYMGSRESKNFTRCYWKPDRLRLEREIKKKEAQSHFEKLLEIANSGDVNAFALCIARMAIGAIDFVNRTSPITGNREKNIKRCERLDWWQQLVDLIGEGIRIKVSEDINPVEKSLDWYPRQVFSQTQAIREGMGEKNFVAWLKAGMEDKRNKQSRKHKQLTAILKIEYYDNAA